MATITLVALVGLRAVTDLSDPRQRLRFTVVGEVAIALTLVILFVALRRLGLSQQAYGLTMLRLFSLAFALWIAVVLLFAGVALGGVGAERVVSGGRALHAACRTSDPPFHGWAAANASRRRATDARRQVCASGVVRR